jgi:hypothetical protein
MLNPAKYQFVDDGPQFMHFTPKRGVGQSSTHHINTEYQKLATTTSTLIGQSYQSQQPFQQQQSI